VKVEIKLSMPLRFS